MLKMISFRNCVFNQRATSYPCFLSIAVAILLIFTSFAIADTDEEAAVEAEAPEKSPLKIGGALRVNYVYGTYGSEESPHRRGEKIGDADLEIFRLNADLDFHNIISRS